MAANTAAYGEVLKIRYEGVIRDLIPTKTRVLQMALDRDSKEWGGQFVEYPAQVGRTQGVGWGSEGGMLPAPGQEKYQSFRIPMHWLYGRVQFTAQAMAASEGNRNAFAGIMQREMDGLLKTLQSERARSICADGRGVLALVNGASATATVTLDAPGGFPGATNGARFINPGMVVGFVNPASGALRASSVRTVQSVAANGTTMVLDSAISVSDNDFVVRALGPTVTDVADTSYQKESMGFAGLVDDGTNVAIYHNISRAGWPIVGSYVLNVGGAISADALQRGIDIADQRGDGNITDLIMHHSVRRALLAITDSNRRYVGGDLQNPDAGTRAAKMRDITFGDIPVTTEKYWPYNTVTGLDRDGLYHYVLKSGEWADDDGNVLARSGVGANGVDVYEAYYRIWDEYQHDNPAGCFRLDGISGTTIVAAHVD